ncbi:SDR family NAD(P)-dependent oxidoreductase [Hominifimenecus sp. rT4P-3]|uniref:SDR family NAD(P)-dependent oxidoreductase n=1 Tax=Hominifimenecus sp. rT4P-3 TaxID=3242979 RepID=UPI003DA5BCF5
MLTGKNAIITGANRGIGRAIVEKFAANGSNIWACARTPRDEFEQDMEALAKQYHVWIRPVYFDLLKEDSIKAGFKEIYKTKEPIDILVNNAGLVHAALFPMTPLEEIRRLFEVNVFSVMELTQLVLKRMMQKKRGVILNMASVAGQDAVATNSIYGSSKAAIISFTRILASEMADYGIRVNAIAPGPVRTDMIEILEQKMGDNLLMHTAMGRLAEPEEIAETALFLASSKSSFINGQIIRIDGGMK